MVIENLLLVIERQGVHHVGNAGGESPQIFNDHFSIDQCQNSVSGTVEAKSEMRPRLQTPPQKSRHRPENCYGQGV